jgi:hypothetical protein
MRIELQCAGQGKIVLVLEKRFTSLYIRLWPEKWPALFVDADPVDVRNLANDLLRFLKVEEL